MRHLRRWTALALLAATGTGCMRMKETFQSRKFRADPWNYLFHEDDPLTVLRESTEGDERAWAMRKVGESGVKQANHEEVVTILTTSATTDKQAVCRLAAIDALSRMDDPRAEQALVTAFHNASFDSPTEVKVGQDGIIQAGRRTKPGGFPQASSFTPDTITTIQSRAIDSLGERKSEVALPMLRQMALKSSKTETPKDDVATLLQGEPAEQGAYELRLAAVRALGQYQGNRDAAETLVRVMRSEKDIGLRSRAYDGLKKVTGKKLPADAKDWDEYLTGATPLPTPPKQSNPAILPVGGMPTGMFN